LLFSTAIVAKPDQLCSEPVNYFSITHHYNKKFKWPNWTLKLTACLKYISYRVLNIHIIWNLLETNQVKLMWLLPFMSKWHSAVDWWRTSRERWQDLDFHIKPYKDLTCLTLSVKYVGGQTWSKGRHHDLNVKETLRPSRRDSGAPAGL